MGLPARQSCRLPRYPSRPHSTGQARVQFNGKVIYLGKFGSPESKRKFAQVIAEAVAAPDLVQLGREVTVADLCAAYLAYAKTRYVKAGRETSEIGVIGLAISALVDVYPDLPANEFGVQKLAVIQANLVQKYTRRSVDRYVSVIRRIWRWGAQTGAVKAEVWMSLKALERVRRGLGKEKPPVACVAREHVLAVLGAIKSPFREMIQVQELTGMRPGEVCGMDWSRIDRSGAIWVYRPAHHKMEHRGLDRVIFIGPRAQAILAGFSRGGSFTDQENQSGNETGPVFPGPSGQYSPGAYLEAIYRTCNRLGIPRWSPNRLRHNAATVIRRELGLEASRVALGHTSADVTQVYAERDSLLAVRAAELLG